MNINYTIDGKADKNLARVFGIMYRRAMTKSTEFMFAKCFEAAPVGKAKSGSVNLRNALEYDFDWSLLEAYIGIPKGSELERIAFYTEMGTGERGQQGWIQWFDEKKPEFTIPIVPLKAKVLHFVNDSGKDIFMKSSKGQKPQFWMRKTFYDNKKNVAKIWKKEGSTSNVKTLLKKLKVENL